MLGIAISSRDAGGKNFIDTAYVVLAELHVESRNVLFQILATLSSRDGHDVLVLGQHPCQRQLSRLAAFLFRDFLDSTNQGEIFLKVLTLKARRESAVVVFRKIFEPGELSG